MNSNRSQLREMIQVLDLAAGCSTAIPGFRTQISYQQSLTLPTLAGRLAVVRVRSQAGGGVEAYFANAVKNANLAPHRFSMAKVVAPGPF